MWRKDGEGNYEFLVGGKVWGRVGFLSGRFIAMFLGSDSRLICHWYNSLKDARIWVARMYSRRNDKEFCDLENDKWMREEMEPSLVEEFLQSIL